MANFSTTLLHYYRGNTIERKYGDVAFTRNGVLTTYIKLQDLKNYIDLLEESKSILSYPKNLDKWN